MSAKSDLGQSIGIGVGIIMCDEPPADLTPEQLAALHLCKSEISSAIFRVYMTVPQKVADGLLKKYIVIP